MTDIESLRLLTEAVETAGADIAPTYAEYVQLAFAIATDCGEAGREFFHRLCRISAKYQSAHAERMFSNALTKQQGAIHLGTAFHLAESTGVKICKEARKEVMNNRTGTVGTESSPHNFSTHAHVYNKVEEEKSESEELLEGSDPHHPLPTFTLEKSRLRNDGQRACQSGNPRNAFKQNVPHFRQQYRYRYPSKYYG